MSNQASGSSAILASFDAFKSSSLERQFQCFALLTATFNGLILWELITCFPSEAKYIFWPDLKAFIVKRKVPKLATLLLFNARLLVIPVVGISFAMIVPTSGSSKVQASDNFDYFYKPYIFLFSSAFFNGTAVFVIRTLAIRDSKRPMTIFLWCCYIFLCGFRICSTLTSLKPSEFLTAKTFKLPFSGYLLWLLLTAFRVTFDVLVLALSIGPQLDGFRWRPVYCHAARRFYFDAILCFAIILVVSIFDFVWMFIHHRDPILCSILVPIHIWLMVTISPRIIRNLRLHSAKVKMGEIQDTSAMMIKSPFACEIDMEMLPLPTTSVSRKASSGSPSFFIVSKERTVHYSSSHL